jgi:hypothetical protein
MKGMTLVEVLLASVMASGMMLALSQSLQNSQRTVKRTMLKSNFSNLMHLVRQGLNEPLVCSEALRRFQDSSASVSRSLAFSQQISLTSVGLVSRVGGTYAPIFRLNSLRNDYKATAIELRRIYGTTDQTDPLNATQLIAYAYLGLELEEGNPAQTGLVSRRSSGFIPGGTAVPTGMTPDTLVLRLTLNASTRNIVGCSVEGANTQAPGLFDCVTLDSSAKTIPSPGGGHKKCSLVQLGLNPLGEATAGSLWLNSQGSPSAGILQNPANGLQFLGNGIAMLDGASSPGGTIVMNANIVAGANMLFGGATVWSGTTGRVESSNVDIFGTRVQAGIDSPDNALSLQVNGSFLGLEPIESKLLVTRPAASFGGTSPVGNGDVTVDGPTNLNNNLRVDGASDLGDVEVAGTLDSIGDVEVKGTLRSETADIRANTVLATGVYQLNNSVTIGAGKSFNLSHVSPTPLVPTGGIKFDVPVKLEAATNQGGNVPFKCLAQSTSNTSNEAVIDCGTGSFAIGAWASCSGTNNLMMLIPQLNGIPVTGGARPNGWKARCSGTGTATINVSCCRY